MKCMSNVYAPYSIMWVWRFREELNTMFNSIT